jgi:hypothetical protein
LHVLRKGVKLECLIPIVKVKNPWSYASVPSYIFMAWCLIKHRESFTLHSLKLYVSLKERADIEEF